ncbi:YIP1 family protein [candidate division TA06 bacterium]|nr:YIP1 family protein [candidate division TA06 bacterium]
MGLFQRMTGIFHRPGVIYQNLSEKPDWVVPFVLVLVSSLIFVSITLPTIILPEQSETVLENLPEGMSQEQKDQIVERMTGAQGMIFGLLGTLFVFLFLLFGRAGIFLGIFSLLGGKSTYRHSMAVVSYAMLIHIVDAIVKAPLMFAKKTAQVYTSLALLLPGADPLSKLFQILNRFDLFTLWELSLLSIGFAVMNKIPLKKSAGTVYGLWISWVLLSVFIGGFFQSR